MKCEGCGEKISDTQISDSLFDGFGRTSALLSADREGHVHMHGVVVANRDALTVRGSLRRWSYYARLRSRLLLQRHPLVARLRDLAS